METQAQHAYCFGPFVLDPAEKVLLRDGHAVNLPPKAIETLLALLEKSGHVMDKSELLQRVWPDTFVEEATLAQNIFTLRKALKESPGSREYIETVPKRGYRFVAPVQGVRNQDTVSGRPRWRFLWVAGAFLTVALSLGIYLRGRPLSTVPATGATGVMLAVLPFENLSGDPKQEYFSDGLTEEMIAQVSRLNPERLRVIARTSSMQYKGTTKSVAQIGHELGVDYILESSVRREGDRARITTQLIRVSDQTHLWSQSYERDAREILPLESDLARAIAREIEIKLSPQEQTRLASAHPLDPEAHQLYLMGRYFWNKRNREDLQKATEYFERAIAKDPAFALAYSGLADSYSLISPTDGSGRAKAAAQKALELDDTLAETHTSMTLAGGWARTPAETEAHFKRALELNPNYATAHHWYALFLKDTGRMDEAILEIQRAQELDPLSLVINADVGLVDYFARRYEEAIQQCRKTLEMDSNFRLAHWELGMAYEAKKDLPEAVKEYETATKLDPDVPLMWAYLGRAYALSGRRTEALNALRKLDQFTPQAERPIGSTSLLYEALGDREQTFAWLERAYENNESTLAWSLRLDPRFDAVRGDPRFANLIRRTRLVR